MKTTNRRKNPRDRRTRPIKLAIARRGVRDPDATRMLAYRYYEEERAAYRGEHETAPTEPSASILTTASVGIQISKLRTHAQAGVRLHLFQFRRALRAAGECPRMKPLKSSREPSSLMATGQTRVASLQARHAHRFLVPRPRQWRHPALQVSESGFASV